MSSEDEPEFYDLLAHSKEIPIVPIEKTPTGENKAVTKLPDAPPPPPPASSRGTAPAVTLNPDNEFERCLIDMVVLQRKKSQSYGQQDDLAWNFYQIAQTVGTTPLRAVEILKAKHEAALLKWWTDAERPPDETSDDAYMDRAVYSVLALMLYKRFKGN